MPQATYSTIDTFIAALSSLEFQQNLGAHLVRSYPEKRRLYFVHIPKTAGVDLATHLISRFPSLSTTLLDQTLTPAPEQLFLAIKHIVLEMAHSDTVFITGHTPLGTYQSWNGNGIRFLDDIFTVVRQPLDQILSQVNYTLTRIFSDECPVMADTAGWRKEFEVFDVGHSPSREAVLQLARRILRHQGVVVPNVICEFLGGGSYEQSLAQTVAHDLEVIELNHLDSWSENKWNIMNRSRLNTSKKFVSADDFSADDMEYAHSIIQDDLRYYGLVMKAYERHGGTAVKGIQLVG